MKKYDNFETVKFSDNVNIIPSGSMPEEYPVHWHKCVEITYLPYDAEITSAPEVLINQTTYVLNPGDIVIAWSGELHQIIKNVDHKLIGIQFYASVFNASNDFASYLSIFRSKNLISYEDNSDLAQLMGDYILHMEELSKEDIPFKDTQIIIALYEMFMNWGIQIRGSILSTGELLTPESNKTVHSVVKACNYIQENCEQQMTLQTVADYVGFSTFYLSRIFKKITNSTFMEYLTNQRIKRAQTMLVDSDMPITEISYQSGFTSISTFNRVFKKYRGCSPSTYRKYYM